MNEYLEISPPVKSDRCVLDGIVPKYLLKNYGRLPQEEKLIFQVLCFTYEPVSQSQLKRIMAETGWARNHDSLDYRALAKRVAKPMRERWIEKKLITIRSGKWWANPRLVDRAILDLQTTDYLATTISNVCEVLPLSLPEELDRDYTVSKKVRRAKLERYYRHVLYTADSNTLKSILIEHQDHMHSIRVRATVEYLAIDIFSALIDGRTDASYRLLVCLPKDTSQKLFPYLIRVYGFTCLLPECVAQFLRQCTEPAPGLEHGYEWYALVEEFLFRGDIDWADMQLGNDHSPSAQALKACVFFLRGYVTEAWKVFNRVVDLEGSNHIEDKLSDRVTLLYSLCALHQAQSSSDSGQQLQRFFKNSSEKHIVEWNIYTEDEEEDGAVLTPSIGVFQCQSLILKALMIVTGKAKDSDDLVHALTLLFQGQGRKNTRPLVVLVRALMQYWFQVLPESSPENAIRLAYEQSHAAGYHWVARELSQLLYVWRGISLNEAVKSDRGYALVDLLSSVPVWERRLDALVQAVTAPELTLPPNVPTSDDLAADIRIVWQLGETVAVSRETDHVEQTISIKPRQQRRTKSGYWSKGKVISLDRFYHLSKSQPDDLSAYDRKMREYLQEVEEPRGHYYVTTFQWSTIAALQHLQHHPHLIVKDDNQFVPIKIVEQSPILRVTQTADQARFTFQPAIHHWHLDSKGNRWGVVFMSALRQVQLICATDAQLRVAALLGEEGLSVPLQAMDRITASLQAMAPAMRIHSDVAAEGVATMETVMADSTIQAHLHLAEGSSGLDMQWWVQPVEGGEKYLSGEGDAKVTVDVAGRPVLAMRDLEKERQLVRTLIKACPQLREDHKTQEVQAFSEDNFGKNSSWTEDEVTVPPHHHWHFPDLEVGLEVLLFLQQQSDHVSIHWPEGQSLKLTRELDRADMAVTLRTGANWFETDAALKVSDTDVVNMRRLLKLMKSSPGRFVRLNSETVLVLTQQLRNTLDRWEAIMDGERFHPLASHAVESLLEGMELKSKSDWRKQLKKFEKIQTKTFPLPRSLNADLRDYQVAGYEWLMRLAQSGAGACLADDMGLGKTLQALAVLLQRSRGGPALVLAPTSVCFNWVEETQRFAPKLNPLLYRGPDRTDHFVDLKPGDLVICSYGLLQSDIERLAEIEWNTIVADEAQAIKNPLAKRSKAAMALRADFKMATTGTPIENNLVELWSLFRFINPGLLGSLERFNKRFATPIEVYGRDDVKAQLKQLIQPFLLRRLKSDVLNELPERTDIVIHVDMSRKERACYEALRQQAVDKMTASDSKAGKKHIEVLAELMRLRRACCHPDLVLPDAALKGSKLAAFCELVEEIVEGGHKALVFSQFVDHLRIIEEQVSRMGVAYQYLDGSTPAGKRKNRVKAFQEGEGDVFLISLKAGGVGLNLTAADYVIHMDPWWNPAVEDQASDRAHRMGQTQPVTVYRLVTRNTVEEKIVRLHEKKRDLATSLLDATGAGKKISLKDMMNLIQDE